MKINIEIVSPEEQEKMNEVFRIRYLSYVKEGHVVLENEEQLMKDEFDNVFPSVLIYDDTKPIGTVRFEISELGSMEPEKAVREWSKYDWHDSIYFCRFAILRDYRHKGVASRIWPALLKSDYIKQYNFDKAYFATNNEKLARHYRFFGKCIDDEPREYLFMNQPIPGYKLFKIDLGRKDSVKRKLVTTYFSTVDALYKYID